MTIISPGRRTPYVPRLSLKQRRAYQVEVEKALAGLGSSSRSRSKRAVDPKVAAAIERTARILQYESYASPAHRWFSHRLHELRTREMHGPNARYLYPRYSPRTMLARVLEHYAMVYTQPWRFPTANAEHEALGRAFLLTARGKRTWRATWYRAAGRYIAQELGSFCIPFTHNNVAPLLEAEQNNNENNHGP
jgi:hypothetical protein